MLVLEECRATSVFKDNTLSPPFVRGSAISPYITEWREMIGEDVPHLSGGESANRLIQFDQCSDIEIPESLLIASAWLSQSNPSQKRDFTEAIRDPHSE